MNLCLLVCVSVELSFIKSIWVWLHHSIGDKVGATLWHCFPSDPFSSEDVRCKVIVDVSKGNMSLEGSHIHCVDDISGLCLNQVDPMVLFMKFVLSASCKAIKEYG